MLSKFITVFIIKSLFFNIHACNVIVYKLQYRYFVLHSVTELHKQTLQVYFQVRFP